MGDGRKMALQFRCQGLKIFMRSDFGGADIACAKRCRYPSFYPFKEINVQQLVVRRLKPTLTAVGVSVDVVLLSLALSLS